MDEVIWKVDVSDEFLTFTQEPRPKDFFDVAEEQLSGELSGTYCGNRGFDDKQFKLHRKLKASNFYDSSGKPTHGHKDQWGNFSLREWRLAFGFGYAWEPQGYYKYKGHLYTTHINFR